MKTTNDLLTIRNDFTSAEDWRRWTVDILTKAGFSSITTNTSESGVELVSARHLSVPLAVVTLNLTEVLHWDGVSRTPDFEWKTEHSVQIYVHVSSAVADPQELADRVRQAFENTNLAELHMRPKVEQQNTPSKSRFGVRALAIGLIVGLALIVGAVSLGLVGAARDAQQVEHEKAYLETVRMIEAAVGLYLPDNEVLDMGYKVCEAFDDDKSVQDAAATVYIIRLDKARLHVGTAIVHSAATKLCPEHAADIAGWNAKITGE